MDDRARGMQVVLKLTWALYMLVLEWDLEMCCFGG